MFSVFSVSKVLCVALGRKQEGVADERCSKLTDTMPVSLSQTVAVLISTALRFRVCSEASEAARGSIGCSVEFFQSGGADEDAAALFTAGACDALFPFFALHEKSALAQILDLTPGITVEAGGFGGANPLGRGMSMCEQFGRVFLIFHFRFSIEEHFRVGGKSRQHRFAWDAFPWWGNGRSDGGIWFSGR